MAGSWTKLTAKGSVKDLDAISAVMSMLDNGLMIEDYSDFSFNGMYGELVDETILNADKDSVAVSIFVPEEKPIAEFRAFLQDRFRALSLDAEISAEGVSEDDWAENWKKYYKPISLGRVTVVPAWEEYTAKEGEIIVRMDPGMAFGTGTHETTRLVMRILQDVVKGGERVLDVGTGSGILSICASKLGAKDIYAYDIDPVAVRVAKENALADGCENITVGVSDLLKDVDRTAPYGVCVANIVADIILRMLPDIGALLLPGAPLILSGIIAPRKQDVIEAAAAQGFLVEREESENDWVALLVRRSI
ncbi:MAG: 50S ribosomal protein L11 methyltransferase [Clostridia bacterium]|nr:50S ribosomal protein L11 methyltransferase [Clostridia bacterium]